MSEDLQYTMPAIYPKVAELLARPVARLGRALSVHIRPEGEAHTLDSLAVALRDPLGDRVTRLVVLFDRLSREVMDPNRSPSVELAETLIDRIDATLAEMITHSHALLSRPWPEGMTEGRLLLAAVLERPLRDLLGFFEKLRGLILEPARATHGTENINLQLVLEADDELKALLVWLDRIDIDPRRRLRRRFDGFLNLLAGFLLGYWWRRD